MFLKGWDTRNQADFRQKVMKNRACNPEMPGDASNHEDYEKVAPKWCQEDKNRSGLIQGPCWVHPCAQSSPKWWPKTPKCLQNNALDH